jgi:hypothetical protein
MGEGGSTTSQPKPASITPTLNATVPDSYRLKDRDLGRVPAATKTND